MAGTADLGTLQARMGIDTTQFDKNLAMVSGRMQTLGKKMSSVGKKMTMGVTLPIVGAGAAAFKMSSDFESSLSKITGLVGVAGEQVDQWGNQILENGADWGVPPKELADALFFVTSAGIKGAAAMDVLEMSAKASSAGLGETATIADLVTSAMNAYGPANLNAAQATDILVAAVREGKAEAPALAGALGQVLPIASEMGVSFDQVGASVAAMTRTGTDASSASMQLKNILSSLLKPTDQAEQALADMGTSSANLRKMIREDGLAKTLVYLKDVTSEYGETAMAEVFPNIRALSGVLDLMGSNAADNLAVFESLENAGGALAVAFADASNTTEFKMNKAMSQMKATLIQIGDSVTQVVIPIIESLGDKLQSLGAWFDGLSTKQKDMIVKLAGIAAAIGPVLLVVGKMSSGVGALIPKVANLAGAFKGLYAFLLANPWVAAATAILAVGVAIAKVIIQANELTAAEKALKNVRIAGEQAVVKERVELDKLMRIAKSETASKEQRKKAIDKINEIMPDYLGNIDEETIKTGEAETAINQYIKTLEHKARMEAAQEMLVELEKERIKALQEGTDEQISGWTKLLNLWTSGQTGISASALNEASATLKATKAQADYIAMKEQYLKIIDEETTAVNNATEAQNEYNKSTETGNTSTNTATTNTEKQTTATEGLALSLEDVNTNIKTLTEQYQTAATEQERMQIQAQIADWNLFAEAIQIASSAIKEFPKPEIVAPTMPDPEEPPALQGQNVNYTSDVVMFGDGINELQEYDAAMQQLSADMDSNGVSSQGLQAQIDLTKSKIQSLKEDGFNPTSAAIKELENNLTELEEKQKEVEWAEDWKSAMEEANEIINAGVTNMAIGLAEGIGAMAAGTASMSDIWNVLLGGVADMAIQLGKLAVSTGIAVKGIMEALKANPTLAIIGGIALIALGSFVKNKMASIAEGKEGGDMSVPGLAKGGVVDSPTLVMVGEYPGAKTNPEIITPENKMQAIFQDVLLKNLTNDSETNLNALTGDLKAFSPLADISYPDMPEKSLESVKTLFEDAAKNFTDLGNTKNMIGADYELPKYTPPSREMMTPETNISVDVNTPQQRVETDQRELVAEVRGEDIHFMLKKVDKRINRYG